MNLIKNTVLVLVLAFIFEGTAYARKKDIIELRASIEALDTRLQKIESRSDNQALMELYKTIEVLKQEVQALRGEMEQLSHEINGVSKRQRNMYLDIDRRLNDLQIGSSSATSSPAMQQQPQKQQPDKPVATNSAAGSKQERDDYGAAFNYLKEGRYAEAVEAFNQFIENYPTGRYAENAQYWLGEANYASRQFEQALIEFEKVLKTYPTSTKVPGAKLKMGYTYYELQRWREARDILNDVLRNYSSSSVAPLAEKRLIRMTQEGY